MSPLNELLSVAADGMPSIKSARPEPVFCRVSGFCVKPPLKVYAPRALSEMSKKLRMYR